MDSAEPAVWPGALNSSWVFEHYRAPILRYIRRLVSDPAEAEDLAQETFLRVHSRLSELKDQGALESWLYRIATHVCYDRFRSAGHRHHSVSWGFGRDDESDAMPLADEAALRPDQLLEQHAMSHCVLRFLTALPESYRSVLLLHDLQGLTDREIAAQTGRTVETVKMRLHRGRVRLKATLSQSCDFSRNDRGVFVCEPKSAGQ